MNEVITYAVKLIFALLGVLITAYVVPWLKRKNLYDTVIKFVRAAEKIAQNAEIDKKEYVITLLKKSGIEVTPIVDALIECAVEEIDPAKK